MSMEVELRQRAIKAFSAVDGILVINMDSSPGRYASFLSSVGQYLPEGKVHRISAVAGRQLETYGRKPWFTENTGTRASFWGGTGGCALSHRNAIAYAKAQGWRNVLIFEDDVFVELSQDSLELFESAVRNLSGAYMLYLGYHRPAPYGRKRMVNVTSTLWQTSGVLTTHAYVMSAELYDSVLNIMPQTDGDIWRWLSSYRAVDVLYRDFVAYWHGVKIYVMDPIICKQRDGESDIGLNASHGESNACVQSPISIYSLRGVVHLLLYPFRRLKIKMNSWRTQFRARRGGLPGYKKRKK